MRPAFILFDPFLTTLLGQYLLLSSMVLHLRYPNAHTHWFSSLFLYLFLDANDDSFREIVTRVLMERFVVHRPHPWGALVTFIELLRNPKYDFWSTSFVRAAPEVTLLLDSVGHSMSTLNSSLHPCFRLPDPSLYLKRTTVLWSVHHLSHLLFSLHFQAITSRTVLYSHTAIITLLSTIWTLFHITVDTPI